MVMEGAKLNKRQVSRLTSRHHVRTTVPRSASTITSPAVLYLCHDPSVSCGFPLLISLGFLCFKCKFFFYCSRMFVSMARPIASHGRSSLRLALCLNVLEPFHCTLISLLCLVSVFRLGRQSQLELKPPARFTTQPPSPGVKQHRRP